MGSVWWGEEILVAARGFSPAVVALLLQLLPDLACRLPLLLHPLLLLLPQLGEDPISFLFRGRFAQAFDDRFALRDEILPLVFEVLH